MDGCKERWMDRWIEERVHQYMPERVNAAVDRKVDSYLDSFLFYLLLNYLTANFNPLLKGAASFSRFYSLLLINENKVISTNPFVLLTTRFGYYPVCIIKPLHVKIFFSYKQIRVVCKTYLDTGKSQVSYSSKYK